MAQPSSPLRRLAAWLRLQAYVATQAVLFVLVDVIALAFVRRGNGKGGEPGPVVVVRTDSLGDYLLFRNFLRTVRAHPAYRGRRLVLCNIPVARELAEALDGDIVDEFVWVPLRTLRTQPLARFRFLRRIKHLGASVVLNPYLWLGESDVLARATSAPERIGFALPPEAPTDTGLLLRRLLRAGSYTHLAPHPGALFEFDRNRAFFAAALPGTPLSVRLSLTPAAPFSAPLPEGLPEGSFALLFPGAQEAFREWPAENFARAARHLRERHGLAIVVAGTAGDRGKARTIEEQSGGTIIDLTGKLTLPQLVRTMERCAVVLSNDSGGIHLAAALGKPGVAAAARTSLVYFHPYPPTQEKEVHFVYPRILGPISTPEEAATQTGLPPVSVATVETDDVLAALDNLMKSGGEKINLLQPLPKASSGN